MGNRILINTGLKKYEVNDNGAVFSFNPKDFNIMAKIDTLQKAIEPLMNELGEEAEKVAKELKKKGYAEGSVEAGTDESNLAFAHKLEEADKFAKAELAKAFGKQNDFDAIFDYVNAFTVTDSDGACVISNFLLAIAPIIKKDVNAEIKKQKNAKVAEFKKNSKSKKK